MYLRLYVRARVALWELKERLLGEEGATAVEYALMVGLIAMVIFSAVIFLGKSVSSQFNTVKFPP
jgi:pilus assembly protein Flp/PilA